MNHRLFHTLVLTSAVLLEGCASREATAPRQAEAPPSSSGASASPAVASTAATSVVTPETPAPPPRDERDAAIATARACGEVGWPTTKGSAIHYSAVMRGARQYLCMHESPSTRYPNLPRCCAVQGAQ